MNRSTPGLPVHHQLPEFTQTHTHRVHDAIQPSPPPAPNPSQHQSFLMSQLFAWGGQSTGVSALASFLPKKSQGWSSEWSGWISSQSKGLSRVFSNTTFQKHQFFGAQLSSQSWWNHYIWEVCSTNWWAPVTTAMPAADMSQQKEPSSSLRQCPTLSCTTITSKVEQIELQSFASSAMFTRPLANQLPVLQVSWQLFAGKKFSQPAWCRKSFLRVRQILRHGFLCCRNKQTYFSLSKMSWLQWFLFY